MVGACGKKAHPAIWVPQPSPSQCSNDDEEGFSCASGGPSTPGSLVSPRNILPYYRKAQSHQAGESTYRGGPLGVPTSGSDVTSVWICEVPVSFNRKQVTKKFRARKALPRFEIWGSFHGGRDYALPMLTETLSPIRSMYFYVQLVFLAGLGYGSFSCLLPAVSRGLAAQMRHCRLPPKMMRF